MVAQEAEQYIAGEITAADLVNLARQRYGLPPAAIRNTTDEALTSHPFLAASAAHPEGAEQSKGTFGTNLLRPPLTRHTPPHQPHRPSNTPRPHRPHLKPSARPHSLTSSHTPNARRPGLTHLRTLQKTTHPSPKPATWWVSGFLQDRGAGGGSPGRRAFHHGTPKGTPPGTPTRVVTAT